MENGKDVSLLDYFLVSFDSLLLVLSSSPASHCMSLYVCPHDLEMYRRHGLSETVHLQQHTVVCSVLRNKGKLKRKVM